jgi:molecular chaperone HscB
MDETNGSPSVDLSADFFALFQLPRTFRLDLAELDARYLALQGAAHPDRFVRADERTRRLSMQRAAQVNEACQTLKHPLKRAQYLLALAGHDVADGRNAVMEPEFLMTQMEWREAVMAARQGGDPHELARLQHRLSQEMRQHYERLAVLIDDTHEFEAAAGETRRLMFMEKLRMDINDALAFLEDNGMDD